MSGTTLPDPILPVIENLDDGESTNSNVGVSSNLAEVEVIPEMSGAPVPILPVIEILDDGESTNSNVGVTSNLAEVEVTPEMSGAPVPILPMIEILDDGEVKETSNNATKQEIDSEINIKESGSEWLFSNDNLKISHFVIPSIKLTTAMKLAFLKQHPIQPSADQYKLPFKSHNVYFRQLPNGEEVQRKWLSFCLSSSSIHCVTCMMFGTHSKSHFVTGFQVTKKTHHLYDALKSHEISKLHINAVSAALQADVKKDILSCIDVSLTEIHKKEVELRRSVIKRIIDIIIFIGRQGLAYRGREEAAYSLDNRKQNHGNFLELVLFLSDYDTILKEHVLSSIKLSKLKKIEQDRKNEKEGREGISGRGSLVTFLSKSFINKLIRIIGMMLQNNLIEDVKKAGIYSIQIDSTQDVSVMEQLAISVRYVLNGAVHEKFIKLAIANDSTGQGLYNKIVSVLDSFGLSKKLIVACSFDGASNMQGKYNGVQSFLKIDNPSIINTHCMAHVLNLVMVDSTQCCLAAENLFGLVESCAVFLSVI